MDQRGERDPEMTWSTSFDYSVKYLIQFNGKIEISDYFLYFQLKSALFSLEHSLSFHNVRSVVDGENNF